MGIMAPGQPTPSGYVTPKVAPKSDAKPPIRVNVVHRACDECGYSHDLQPIGKAKHQVEVIGGTLYFCNHHFEKHCLAFIASEYRVTRV